MRAPGVSAGWLIACALLAGCGGADERYCKLTMTQVVASTDSKVIDAIAFAEHGQGAVLVWSDTSGAFARVLDAAGKPRGEVSSIGERCDGGVALASSSSGELAFACLQRAVARDIASQGQVVVSSIAQQGATLTRSERARFSPAGTLSEGVALLWSEASLALAWHDASPDVHRIMFVPHGYGGHVPWAVSNEASVAHAPAFVHDGRQVLLAFNERLARGETFENNVMLWAYQPKAPSKEPTRSSPAVTPKARARPRSRGPSSRRSTTSWCSAIAHRVEGSRSPAFTSRASSSPRRSTRYG